MGIRWVYLGVQFPFLDIVQKAGRVIVFSCNELPIKVIKRKLIGGCVIKGCGFNGLANEILLPTPEM